MFVIIADDTFVADIRRAVAIIGDNDSERDMAFYHGIDDGALMSVSERDTITDTLNTVDVERALVMMMIAAAHMSGIA